MKKSPTDAELEASDFIPEPEPFQLYVLRNIKYHQAVLDEYQIYFSKTFKHYVTFRHTIACCYPSAILRVVEFGDLTLDPRLAGISLTVR